MKYFLHNEVSCNCGCKLYIENTTLFNMIDEARRLASVPFVITSWTRCEKHNKAVGGSTTSSHISGKAIDIKFRDSVQKFKIIKGLLGAGFCRIGINDKAKFIHCDIDLNKISDILFTY